MEFAKPAILLLFLAVTALGCVRPNPNAQQSGQFTQDTAPPGQSVEQTGTGSGPVGGDGAATTPEPDPIEHTVQLGETLSTIARDYGTSVEALLITNEINDGNLILPGQVLSIPQNVPDTAEAVELPDAADTEIITDQELVYGPSAKEFELETFLRDFDGYLLGYEEEVEGQTLDGPGIVQLVADRHSVNPRLLLALLEYQSGWLSAKQPDEVVYMLGNETEGAEGLYRQLSWAANMLNLGFYGRSEGGVTTIRIGENAETTFPPTISDGTAGVQNYLASRDGVTPQTWLQDAGPAGLAATYRQLFGGPTAEDKAPLLPDDLQQPPLELPWASGETWYFTGGPHGGWNSGSAWAALDFVPSEIDYGCVPSDSWATAMAGGVIARSGFGAVVLDLDGDGYEGTGWAITYMHLDNRQRIGEGVRVSSGEPLGHPGCEGGVTNGTHVHLARTYNGRWIAADGAIPFDLGGWESGGEGFEYNGWLARDGEVKTADVFHTEDNAITAD